MTPAVAVAKQAGIPFELLTYSSAAGVESYGEEAARLLNQPTDQVFKTLLVACDGDPRNLAVAIVPVCTQLNLKALATALGVKKVQMADPQVAQRSTGYLVGGISPLGQKKRLPSVLDRSAEGFARIYISGGRRGLEMALAPADLVQVIAATWADIGR